MPSTVKSLKVTYKPVNEDNTFTSGDCVSGEVSLELAKECSIDALSVKLKGKAEVLWSERHGQTTVVYHAKDKYFSLKHFFIQDKDAKGNDDQTRLTDHGDDKYNRVVAAGYHVYPFSFQVPYQNLPSSFKGSAGKIVYLLEAKLSRSMRIPTKDSTKINFVSKEAETIDPELMKPQHESKDKKMKVFNSGTVAMDVNLEKTGFFQGEGLKVIARIQNNSSRPIKLKYCVYRKHSFFAKGKRNVITKDLLKEVGEPIPPSAEEKFTRVIPIPFDVEPSIENCSIIKVEYRLRVYLDVKYASDPEIKFPIVILPARLVPAACGFGFESTEPIAWGFGPPAAPAPSGAPPPYGAYGMFPPIQDFDKKCQ
ncbi:arrestin domain-containing protein 3-like [Pseudoliparis swirei]|uniref:arrestin domain-containing protein 3-like n=1 Tax=Pseudoliparis swirei TaxID=2059687 RepID=UPI0024BED6F2|nr:arrestin domain-containing protein 3-like [Pseudoliparis swirei]